MIAGGAAAHSDHGRSVAEVFMSAARKETDAYKIKDTNKLLSIAPYLDVATTVEVDGETKDRDIDEIALEVAEKAHNEWGKEEGELLYAETCTQGAPLRKMEESRRASPETSTGKSWRSCTEPIWASTRITKI